MKKVYKLLSLLLTLAVMACLTGFTIAPINFKADSQEVQKAINRHRIDKMTCTIDTNTPNQSFINANYWTSSTRAMSGSQLNYRTTKIKVRIGAPDDSIKGRKSYFGEFDAADFRADPGPEIKQNEKYYTHVKLDTSDFTDAINQTNGTNYSYEEIQKALDIYDRIFVGATIEVFRPATGEVLQRFETKTDVLNADLGALSNYKNEMLSRYNTVPIRPAINPDFSPVPTGESQWNSSYQDPQNPPVRVNGKPGEKKDVEFDIINTGNMAEKTTVEVCWWGRGDNPIYTSPTNIIEPKSRMHILIPQVEIPEITGPNSNLLVVKLNKDGLSPERELNLGNNTMVIAMGDIPGVDLAITGKVSISKVQLPSRPRPMPGVINYTITRKDTGTTPIQAKLTMYSPNGTKTETITLAPGQTTTRPDIFRSTSPGTYQFRAEIWPTTIKELRPADNTTGPHTVQFTKMTIPGRIDGDTGLEAGLTG